ncbi:MAG: epoxyqueuosine reductase QueH [Treponema sp.]|jgi:tRNA A37 threonylcarbamoyladenosine dehydratase/predicted adenine nucleotide alpha hydrolase (AANH) superfamily ATPase|nr:epoxyqueuosine reductase QueH [Treponema sp.]
MKLLFHCCCAPCATACIENLSAESIAPTLFWYNPNIHPLDEYQKRRDALSAFAAAQNLPLEIIDEYGEETFLSGIGSETEAPKRCELCYRMRLERAAAFSAENGFDAFSTSLLISPYQNHDAIRSIGEELAARHGLQFFYKDFRPLFRQGQNKARALGLYMQKYCGCMFSINEKNVKKSDNNFDVDPLFQRLALLIGTGTLKKLAQASVLVVGVGGVGSWCAEALVRSGIGRIGIVDFDTVCASNVNRQLQATSRTLGTTKVEVLKQRLLEINPRCEVSAWEKVFSKETAAEFGIETMDYVIDAIDSIEHKLDLIETAYTAGVKLFSSMGMARKLDPTRIKTADIWETQACPLARLVRQGLRKRGFTGNFTAIYSDELLGENKGSVVTVTASAGMVLASLVLRNIMSGT